MAPLPTLGSYGPELVRTGQRPFLTNSNKITHGSFHKDVFTNSYKVGTSILTFSISMHGNFLLVINNSNHNMLVTESFELHIVNEATSDLSLTITG